MYYENIKSSSDGLNLSIAYSIPSEKPKGIIQISHGMAEHKERYFPFMEYLTNNGYICIINDHRWHGLSVKEKEDLGYFYTDNIDYIVNDLYDVTKFAKSKFNCSDYSMFSHSMGTLVARSYIQRYDNEIDKLILCGPPTVNKFANIGLSIAYISRIFGDTKTNNFLNFLTFNNFNKKYNYNNAWLSKNKNNVDKYNKDNLCGFIVTTNGFINLYKLQIRAFKKRLYNCNNKNLKILLIAGQDDPVIGNTKLFDDLKSFLIDLGYNNIDSRLYNQLRHEILNEEEYITVYQDIFNFIENNNY